MEKTVSRLLTKCELNVVLGNLQADLAANGFAPRTIILYGSYANGTPHKYSDIDLAIWSESFSGDGFADFEKVNHILRPYRRCHIKFYPTNADENNFDPFIDEIKRNGIKIL